MRRHKGTQPAASGEASHELSPQIIFLSAYTTPRGLETKGANNLSEKDLRQSQKSSAAQSAAVTVDAIIAMLATLSPEDRARLAALLIDKPTQQPLGITL
jgi:uncharacterized membrane protein